MKIFYTKHAERKFEIHKAAGWNFSKRDIKEAIKEPYFSETDEERGVKTALKETGKKYDLRVIYKEEDDIITVITFYPTEKGRYIK